jgi:hypothetical protein
MRWIPLKFLWLPAVFLALATIAPLTSCSPNPRIISGTESDYLLQLRAEYLAANPDGAYNEYIKRGEVVKGMDILEVLASWGHPEVRKKENALTEHWIYREVDEDSKDWVLFTFTFRRTVLAEWDLMRHFAAGGRVDVPEGRDRTSLTRGEYTTSGSGAPKKK